MAKSYTGVKWCQEHYKYKAIVTKGGVTYPCGMHDTEKAAAMARDKMIIQKGLDVRLQVLKPIKK